ncbi:hypothetical protein RI367_004552 [Sorochytrium milnesiophthora]
MELLEYIFGKFGISSPPPASIAPPAAAESLRHVYPEPPGSLLCDSDDESSTASEASFVEVDGATLAQTAAEPLKSPEYLFQEVVRQRADDVKKWASKRKRVKRNRNKDIHKDYEDRLEDEFGVSKDLFDKLAALFRDYFWKISQKVVIPEDKYQATSFSSGAPRVKWNPEILARYLPAASRQPMEPQAADLKGTKVLAHVKSRYDMLFNTLFPVLQSSRSSSGSGESTSSTGLAQLEDDDVNETFVRIFVDTWLLEVVYAVNKWQGGQPDKVTAHVEWKCPAREHLLSSGAMDYVFTRDGQIFCILETKRGERKLMQQGLVQGIVEALTLQQKFVRELPVEDQKSAVPPTISVVSTNGYRFLFAIVGPASLQVSEELAAETWDDLEAALSTFAGLLGM